MESKLSIFDTTVVGAILFLSFALTLAVANPVYLVARVDKFKLLVLDSNNLLPRWVAIGVASNIFGAIIQMVSICWFKRPFDEPSARECLKAQVIAWINAHNEKKTGDDVICPGAYNAISDAHPDSIFAWIHYSDPREQLIDWGRRKLHYAYLAENWMVSIVMGIAMGGVLGVVQLIRAGNLRSLNHLFLVIPFAVVVYAILRSLNKLREDNKKYDNDMIAMYLAGRIWQPLEERFLPKSIGRNDQRSKIA